MSGAARVREVASLLTNPQVLVRIEPVDPRLDRVQAAARELVAERDRRCGWFDNLGEAISARAEPSAPGAASTPGSEVACAQRCLDALGDLEGALSGAAG